MPQEYSDEYKKVLKILQENKRKNFVRRILKPDKYPSVTLEDGAPASHMMAYGEWDGKYYVYPTIIQAKGSDELTVLSEEDAQLYAQETGEYIEFDNEEDAAWFSGDEGYKTYWDATGK
jgi:hypothetical protein